MKDMNKIRYYRCSQ